MQLMSVLIYSQVEVLYVDTGSSGRVNLSEICREVPPKEMLLRMHRQAVHCFLHGVQPVLTSLFLSLSLTHSLSLSLSLLIVVLIILGR